MTRIAPRARATDPTLISLAIAACFSAGLVSANPVGPAVVSGQASFATAGQSLTVTNSPNAIINWQGFSIGTGEITRFQQQSASSAVLNRVVGQDPSAILGTLSSNGRVYLVNPNGILFGQGSRVDVAGLVATTLNLTNNDFLAGRLNFEGGALANSIVNQGEIVTGSGGRVLLIAPDVQNHGLINTPQGEVVLAAGKSVQLVEADLPMLKVEVSAGGEALNVGQILAEGGKVGVYAGLINQRGVVRADSASVDATGKIVFRSSDTTLLEAGSVTSAAGAKGGEIQVLGNKVGLTGNATVDASGDAGGGTVLVGGDFQGRNANVQNAFRTYVGPETSIQADALVSGGGGKVIVWSDDATRAYGTISARGGAQGGNGGFVEVSGKNWLDFSGSVNTLAQHGSTGTLLLDPTDIEVNATDTTPPNTLLTGGIFQDTSTGTASEIVASNLQTLLGSTSITIKTQNPSGAGSLGGTVTFNTSVIKPDSGGTTTLQVEAENNIIVNGSVTIGATSSANPLNVTFVANSDGTAFSGGGILIGNGDNRSYINTKGGNIVLGGAGTNPALSTGATDSIGVFLNTATLDAGTGSVTIRGKSDSGANGSIRNHGVALSGTGGSSVVTSSGNITITGDGGAGDSASGVGAGIFLELGSSIATVDGAIQLTGNGSATAAGAASGVEIRGASLVESTGLGTVTIIGTGGNTSDIDGGNMGVRILGGGTVRSTSAAIDVQGTGRGAGSNNHGVQIDNTGSTGGVISLGGAPISLTGAYGGSGSGTGLDMTLLSIGTNTVGGASATGDIMLAADTINMPNVSVQTSGVVKVRPLTVSQPVYIETSASTGLSLTPTEIQNITTGTLEIGRSDGSATMVVSALLTSANLNSVNTLRLYSGNINLASVGGDIGSSGTPFAHNLELKANNDVQLTAGNVYLANNKSLTVVADNDSSGVGNVNIGGVTVRVGDGGNTSGNMSITGRAINTVVSGGSGLIEVSGGGTQTFTALGGDVTFQNANTSAGTLLVQAGTNTQTINASGALRILGGTGTSTSANVTTGSGAQSVTTGSVVITGGSAGTGNYAQLNSGGGQTISAAGVTVTGGSAGSSNYARIVQTNAAATQNVTVTGGGTMALQGGGGTDDNALIWSQGASQQITFAAGGSLTVTAGNGASADWASISATAGSQTVSGAPTISLHGGTGGAGGSSTSNYALITVDSAQSQTITASNITLKGGDSGSLNRALILHTGAGAQTVTASGITVDGGVAGSNEGGIIGSGGQTITVGSSGLTLRGGAGGSGGNASVSQQGTTSDQSITVNNDGIVTLTGGGGTNNRALISNQGKAQTLAFTTGGKLIQQGGSGAGSGNDAGVYNTGVSATTQTISFGGGGAVAPEIKLTGGTVGDGNAATISSTGNQTITGNPDITLLGGSSGGSLAVDGNSAHIGMQSGGTGSLQTIAAHNVSLTGGSGGTLNGAEIGTEVTGMTSTISATGSLTMSGGAGTDAFALIGGLTSDGNVTVNVTGAIALTGGSGANTNIGAFAGIGTASLTGGPFNANVTINGQAGITLSQGTTPGFGSAFIGSPGGGGGTVIVNAGLGGSGGITLNTGTKVKTSGSATLKTTGAPSDITLGGVVDTSAGSSSGTTITLDAGGVIVGAGGLLTTSTLQDISLKASAGIGTQANPVRIDLASGGPDEIFALNSTSGDIALSATGGNMQLDGTFTNFVNSNASGAYFLRNETGNIQLDVPFTPNAAALLAGQSVIFDAPAGSVTINSGGRIDATGAGAVTLLGGNTGTSGLGSGVFVDGGRITTDVGAITITGTGKTNAGSGNYAGVVIGDTVGTSPAYIHANSGAINITGTGGSMSGVGFRMLGVRLLGTNSEISASGGSIALTGTGGTIANAPACTPPCISADVRGMRLESDTRVATTGSGSITLTGTGGTLNNAPANALTGGVLALGSVTTVDGNITVNGSGGTTAGGVGGQSRGVSVAGTVEATGTGSISIAGTGSLSDTSTAPLAHMGVLMSGPLLIRTGDGNITIQGTGGVSTGTSTAGYANSGVHVQGGGANTIVANGTGAVGISGTGGSAAGVPLDLGISVSQGSDSLSISTASGNLGISATGDLQIEGGTGIPIGASTGSGAQTISSTKNIVFGMGGGIIDIASGGTQTVSAVGALSLAAGGGTGEHVSLTSTGTQSVSASTISITGGSSGSGNFARIYSGGNQTVSATGIALSGGLDGGGPGTGNFAQIRSEATQSVSVGSGGLALYGGGGSQATASDNFASIYQSGTSGTQTLNVGSGGSIVVSGGDGVATSVDVANNHGSWAYIRADGTAQDINFSTPGSGSFTANAIQVIGGDTGSGNYAGINARNGTQTIGGSPDILVAGGGSGGIAGEGNWAQIYASAGKQDVTANAIFASGGDGYENFARLWSGTQQDIVAASISLSGGESGTANYAVLNAPLQNISVAGNLTLLGGAAAATATSGGGSRIGGFGGSTPSATVVTLDVGGNLVMTGGDQSDSGSAIGNGIAGGQTTDITLNVTGNITLNPGTVANAGSRIGSSASSVAGGTIAVTAGGDIVMNGTASGIGTAIRTTGSVSLQANSITQATYTTILAGQLDVATTAGASLLGGGNQLAAFGGSNTTSGAIELVNASPTLTLTGVSQVPGGAINIAQTGDLVLPTLTFGTGTISASGAASIPSGVTFTVAGGTLSAPTLEVQSGGTLNGTGTVTADVSNSGTVAPGTSAGILAVSGNYTQTSAGALNVEIGGTTAGTEYDRLAVSGSATLGGTLNVIEGATAPVPGTTYTVITCGSCTGTFATVSAPTVSVTPSYVSTSVSLAMGGFLNVWSGGTDWLTAGWSRGLPGPTDDVVIDDGSVTVSTLTISSGSQSIRSIVSKENLTLAGGSLNLAAPSTINGIIALSGGTLAGPGTLAVNELAWAAGTISSGGALAVGSGGARLSNSNSVILDSRAMTVNGPFTMAGSGWLDMHNGATLAVNGLATLDTNAISSSFFGIMSFAGAPSTVSFLGGVTKIGAQPFDLAVRTNTAGTVASQQGELVFDLGFVAASSGGTHTGTSFAAANGASIKFANGTHEAVGNVIFSGGGVTQLGNNDGARAMSFGPTAGGTLTNSGTLNLVSGATLGAMTNQGVLDLAGVPLSGLLTNAGTVNVSGSVSASGGIQQNAGQLNVPSGQTLGVGGSGLVLTGGTLMGNGTISGNVNNSGGTVAPGASPGILTINGNYTQGASGVLAVDVGGTVAGSEYDQLKVIGNVFLDGNLNTTLFGTYTPLPGDSYTFIDATGAISGSFANYSQPPSLLPPVAGISPVTGAAQLTVSVVSPSVPPAIEPSYNYTVVATEISSEPVENVLIPVLGAEGTAGTEESTLEKKPPACS